MTQELVYAHLYQPNAKALGAHQLNKNKATRAVALFLLAARNYETDLPLLRAAMVRGVGTFFLRKEARYDDITR